MIPRRRSGRSSGSPAVEYTCSSHTVMTIIYIHDCIIYVAIGKEEASQNLQKVYTTLKE